MAETTASGRLRVLTSQLDATEDGLRRQCVSATPALWGNVKQVLLSVAEHLCKSHDSLVHIGTACQQLCNHHTQLSQTFSGLSLLLALPPSALCSSGGTLQAFCRHRRIPSWASMRPSRLTARPTSSTLVLALTAMRRASRMC